MIERIVNCSADLSPPDYVDLCLKEDDLPSYSQAVGDHSSVMIQDDTAEDQDQVQAQNEIPKRQEKV